MRRDFRNKKGMLLARQTLKMVLAVICLGFLIYLLVAIYFANINGEKLVQATSVMGRISNVTDNLRTSNFTSENVTELVPAGWSLFSFTDGVKPNSCVDLSCLCICDDITEIELIGRTQQNKCSEDGTCLIIQNLMKFNEIPIGDADEPTSIEIFKNGNWLGVRKI